MTCFMMIKFSAHFIKLITIFYTHKNIHKFFIRIIYNSLFR